MKIGYCPFKNILLEEHLYRYIKKKGLYKNILEIGKKSCNSILVMIFYKKLSVKKGSVTTEYEIERKREVPL